MTTETEGFSWGPSQVILFVSVIILVFSVEGMAGHANNLFLAVLNHIGGNAHGGHYVHGMRPHCISAVIPLMAYGTYVADIVAQGQCAFQEREARVAFCA